MILKHLSKNGTRLHGNLTHIFFRHMNGTEYGGSILDEQEAPHCGRIFRK